MQETGYRKVQETMSIAIATCARCGSEVMATKCTAGVWYCRCRCLGYDRDIIVNDCFDVDQAKKKYEDKVKVLDGTSV